MGKGPGMPRIPAARPTAQSKPAPHVEAAISRTAQPKTAPQAALPGAQRPLAAHVQTAIAAHTHRPAQMKPAPAQPPRPAPAPRPAVAAAPPRPRATVAQLTQYKSVVADEDFIVTPSSSSADSHRLSVTRPGALGNELAYMTYRFYPDKSVTMGHVEAYGMPNGTKVGYLLFYIMAKHAKDQGITTVTIGTGVDEYSTRRNLADAQLRNDQEAITSANQALAAVHIYSSLGFDASNAVQLSRSSVTVDNVIARSRAKIGDNWLVKAQKSGCFLTTACTQARGLPDDCRELGVLRRFRDDLVAASPAGRALVESYYRLAPGILEAIARRADQAEVLEGLYGEIQRAVAAIDHGEPAVALEVYAREVARLVREHLGGELPAEQTGLPERPSRPMPGRKPAPRSSGHYP